MHAPSHPPVHSGFLQGRQSKIFALKLEGALVGSNWKDGWQRWEEKVERRVICTDNSSPGEEGIPTEAWDATGGPR